MQHLSAERRHRFDRPNLVSGVVFIAVVALLQFARMTSLRMDHDENQFVVSGALLARDGLLPYRDYPYFHLPYLLFAYAPIFRHAEHLLLAARIVSTICGTAIVATLFLVTRRLFDQAGSRRANWFALASGLMLMGNPLFLSTSGRSWNHDLPTALTLLATLLLLRLRRVPDASWTACLIGVLGGVCVGVRITFAPCVLAFMAAIALLPEISGRRRLRLLLWFVAGVLIALAPLLVVMLKAPNQFFFGILRFPFLNLQWRREAAPLTSMSAKGKFLYPFENILNRPATFVAVIALLSIPWLVYARRAAEGAHARRYEVTALLGIWLALAVGSIIPTPSFVQYFYTPLPFAILVLAYAGSGLSGSRLRVWSVLFGIAALVAAGFGVPGYRGMLALGTPQTWIPMQVHQIGVEIAERAHRGRVLTLAPIYALEGGATTYPEFTTGPFAFRVSPLVPEPMQSQYKILDADDLEGTLAQRPPSAVLLPTAREYGLDLPIIDYAKRHGLPIYKVVETPQEPPAPWVEIQLSLQRQ